MHGKPRQDSVCVQTKVPALCSPSQRGTWYEHKQSKGSPNYFSSSLCGGTLKENTVSPQPARLCLPRRQKGLLITEISARAPAILTRCGIIAAGLVEKKLKSSTVKSAKRVPSPQRLKKELDRVFSLWIRRNYPSQCYTCGKQGVTLQCGHFIPRNYTATRWDVNNARPQCIGCNLFGGGKPLDFEEHLIKEIGRKAVENLKKKRHNVVRLTITDYQELIEKYK